MCKNLPPGQPSPPGLPNMSIDQNEFDPIIDIEEFPEAFGCAAKNYHQPEWHCLGDGSCSCFDLLQDCAREQVTLMAILEGELEEQANSFASNDNIPGIEGTQIEGIDRKEIFQSMFAPKISADKQAMEPLLTPATMDCDAKSGVISDRTTSVETNSSHSGETISSTVEEGSQISSGDTDSNTCEEIDPNNTTEETDSSTTGERNSSATHNIPGVGTFRVEKTSSDDFMCGMYALEISTEKQLAGDTLTPAVFKDILRSPEMQAFNREKGYRNRNNFHDEQLACVLGIWGRRKRYDRLQLGLILAGGSCYIVGAEDKIICVDSESVMEKELKLGFTTIWIHNNDIMSRQNAAINHYSGVTLLDTNEEQNQARRREAERRKEKADSQEAVLERLKAVRRPLENSQEREEPQKKKLKFRHGN